MQLSTISPGEAEEAVSSIRWVNENVAESAVVLIDEELRGYAAIYCDKEKILIKDIGAPWYSTPRYIEKMYEQAILLSAQGFDVYFVGRDFSIEELEVVKRGDKFNVYHLEN